MSDPTRDDRYARQRLVPGWQQERLAAATILVAGAGALGNEAIKNLALLGVGHLLIVDVDQVERSNLSRTVLFRETDSGQPKAVAAASAATALSPGLRATAIDGDLRFVLGLGRVHRCDLVLGCLDNQGARLLLSQLCMTAGVPLLDAGMWAFGGEVRGFLSAADPCFACTLTPDERSDLWLRYSCSGGFQADVDEALAPTLVTTTAIVAGLLVQEAVRVVTGQSSLGGSALVFNGQAGKLYRTSLTRDPSCRNHAPLAWSEVLPLPASVQHLTAAEVLRMGQERLGAPPILDLGRDLLLALVCPVCGQRDEVGRPQRLLAATAARCPHCGAPRTPQVTSTVTLQDPWASWTLARLGVPDGEVLSVRAGEMLVLYEVP